MSDLGPCPCCTSKPRPYRPSNGTEGMHFIERFCCRCQKYAANAEGDPTCDILERSFGWQLGDQQYPTEWRYGDDGKPTCTAFAPEAKP